MKLETFNQGVYFDSSACKFPEVERNFACLFYNFYSYWGLNWRSTFTAVVYIPLWDPILGFGVDISCNLIHVYHPFWVTCRFHLQGNTIVQNIETCYGMRYRVEMRLPVRWTQQVTTVPDCRIVDAAKKKTCFLAEQERLRTVDSVLFLILCVFCHTGLVYCQFGVCSVCRVHFTLVRAASQYDRPARSPITLRTRGLSSYEYSTADSWWNAVAVECSWRCLGGPWNLACLLGGLERGIALLLLLLLLFQWGGEWHC